MKKKNEYVYLIIILLLTVIVYSNSIHNQFLNWDDDLSVVNNPHIQSLDGSHIINIFSHSYNGMYQPLVMISFAINYALHGLHPEGYHIANLLFHLLNILLVFFFIRLMFKNISLALITAVIFAVHPMHVESVSWITERKDVLYAFFFLFSLIMYLKYLQTNYKMHYLLWAFLLYLCSLLSKTNAITLPLVLITIDLFYNRLKTKKALYEKIPFFLFALVFGVISIISQEVLSLGAFRIVNYSIFDRLVIGCNAFVFYMVKFIFPVHLSALYPFPLKANGFLPMHYYGSVLLLIAILYGTIRLIIKKSVEKETLDKIIFAALFFTFTVSVVIFIPVGKADVADRYTYIPYIGLTVLFYYLADVLIKNRFRIIIMITGLLIIFLFSIISFQRNKIWKDSNSLWSDVIEKYPSSELAYYGRGNFKQSVADFQSALIDFNKAINLYPDFAMAYNNRGAIKLYLKDMNGALTDLNKSILLDPKDHWAYYNRALVFLNLDLKTPACIDLGKSAAMGNSSAQELIIKYCR